MSNNDTPQILITAQLNKAVSLNNITADLKEIEKQLPNLNLKYNIDTNSVNSVQQTTTKVTKSTQDLSAQLGILQNRATGAYGNFTKYLSQNSQVASKLPNQVSAIKNSFESLNKVTNSSELKSSLQQVNSQVTALRGEAKQLGLEGSTTLEKFKSDMGNFITFLGAGTVLMAGVNTVKRMVSTVEDLNKAATDLQMVTGNNSQQTAELLQSYNKLGTQLGATTSEVASSASDFLRQGKSIADTNTLIKDSMILSKVSNIDSADSTTYLTSAMKGYNVEASKAIGIVDKLNAVDLVSATSAAGLAEGMSKVANLANISGVSMDSLLGMLATVGEVTQKSMDEVGTSFQAIFSRMGNVKAGKFVKDSEDDVNDVEKVLDKVGIKLRDAQGNFRNFGTVIDEVGNKWKSYSNLEQNAVSTAIAGKTSLVLEYTKTYRNIWQGVALAV